MTQRLTRFRNGQRVVVIEPERESMRNKTGTVVRKLMRDCSAWVDIDGGLPKGLANFPKHDPRANHIVLWPDECAALEDHNDT